MQVVMAEGVAKAAYQFGVGTRQPQFPVTGFLQFISAIGRVQFRQAPQAAPDAAGRAAFQQDAALGVFQDQHPGGFFGFRFFGFGARVKRRSSDLVGGTVGVYRAPVTGRFGPGADQRAQVHDGLGIVGYPLVGGMGFGAFPESVENRCLARPAWYRVVSGQYPLYVTVQNGCALTKRLGDNGGGCGAANAGEALEGLLVLGKLPVMVRNQLPGGLVQIAGAGIIPQAGPVAEYLVYRRFCQGVDVRKADHKSLEVGDNGGYLGLLEHDLRDPYPIRVPVIVPRQVMPAVGVVPVQKTPGEAVGHRPIRPRRASFTLSPSSPSFSSSLSFTFSSARCFASSTFSSTFSLARSISSWALARAALAAMSFSVSRKREPSKEHNPAGSSLKLPRHSTGITTFSTYSDTRHA